MLIVWRSERSISTMELRGCIVFETNYGAHLVQPQNIMDVLIGTNSSFFLNKILLPLYGIREIEIDIFKNLRKL